jgi:hypothetical protein
MMKKLFIFYGFLYNGLEIQNNIISLVSSDLVTVSNTAHTAHDT